jgi:uncharacterized membrane protein
MDEENKPEQENNNNAESQPSRQHVHIFGAEVNSNDGDNKTADKGGDWAKNKAEWKQQGQEQRAARRAEWHAQHNDWRQTQHHGGGMFWGMVLLLVGVLALMSTMGYVSSAFWHAIVPFWPILLILWGASLVLGRHWFTRFILFIFALIFIIIVIIYGLVRADSPLVSSLSPSVVRAVQISQPQQY